MKDKNNNTGHSNSGDCNSGHSNSGDWNSGDWNSGYGNSGDSNSGNGNSGDSNSGDWNSGHMNSGGWNSGYGNSTNRESGMFCSEEGYVRMFNKFTILKWDEIEHPDFSMMLLTKWMPESEMTDEEKKNEADFSVRGGYLKTFDYKDAWATFWKDTTEENREKVINLPNFDATIFEDITGINVNKDSKNCEGKIIEIDGLEYELKLKK